MTTDMPSLVDELKQAVIIDYQRLTAGGPIDPIAQDQMVQEVTSRVLGGETAAIDQTLWFRGRLLLLVTLITHVQLALPTPGYPPAR